MSTRERMDGTSQGWSCPGDGDAVQAKVDELVALTENTEEGIPCICDGDNVALQVLCRAFDDDPADLIEEWRAFDKSGWIWWGRALGAFIRDKIARSTGEPTTEAE